MVYLTNYFFLFHYVGKIVHYQKNATCDFATCQARVFDYYYYYYLKKLLFKNILQL